MAIILEFSNYDDIGSIEAVSSFERSHWFHENSIIYVICYRYLKKIDFIFEKNELKSEINTKVTEDAGN